MFWGESGGHSWSRNLHFDNTTTRNRSGFRKYAEVTVGVFGLVADGWSVE